MFVIYTLWSEDHARHHNDVLAHAVQNEVELVRKTVRSVPDNLTFYEKLQFHLLIKMFTGIVSEPLMFLLVE